MRYRHSTFTSQRAGAAASAAGNPDTAMPLSKATFRVPAKTGRTWADWPAQAAPIAPAASGPVPAHPAAITPVEPPAQTGQLAVVAETPLDPELLTGPVEVTGITQVTRDVKTFELRAGWMSVVDFAPGQYVTMRIPELGLERCYSISSAPFGTNIFTITVKRVAGGAVSTHLHDFVQVGDHLHVDGPYGLFSTNFHQAERHLFLSAGSGITPIMAMVRSLLARQGGYGTDIAFVHSASTPVDIIFRAELEQLAEVAGVSVTILCSRDGESETWAGRRGRIDADTLAEAVPDAADRETFVCGPGPYMDAVRPLLAEAGVPQARTHEESFVFATSPADRLARAEARAEAAGGVAGVTGVCHSVEFTVSGRVVDCDESTTVLDSALDAGLSMPSSCSEGACGTCKSVLVSGEVEMKHAGGIRPKEIAAGMFLPCCSTPLTDLVVER
ncbi:hybrid-cluster NAD(P)-dependent oxidoreductase [Brevibacterium spongiae]|uniref:FAD-binding oxidoreductase n=1 Tax=Brevibacterium spongiae TaxID=2909672 RepID=A0ABY5SNA7_9MICO|nr:hybrid-cluster NAD(P)-dependent oxidoreductase [Brevibacterium spongiae]UVI36008.1 FAD-binding oxidoreductase [Brevibacterium spongiae]